MTFYGIGLSTLAPAYALLGVLVMLRFVRPDWLRTEVFSAWPMLVLGGLMIVSGAVLHAITVRLFMKAWREKRLLTTGLYGIVRHPLYAVQVWLVMPGVALVLSSTPMLIVPAITGLVLAVRVRREEEYLESMYGDAYRRYHERVPSLAPFRVRLPSRSSDGSV